MPRLYARRPVEERFWSFVDKSGPCWLWTGTKGTKSGYGIFKVSVGKTVSAHRMAWQLAFGPIPEGLVVRHDCDTPACVNPSHLSVGTHAQNSRDAITRGRWSHGATHSDAIAASKKKRRGEATYNHRLTEQEVRIIRDRYAAGESQYKLCDEYDVSQHTIWSIVKRHSWRHVD
jgi:hypothetical protein